MRWGRLARHYSPLADPDVYARLSWIEEKALWQVLADEAMARKK